jgi:hypothetical protein
LLLPAVDRAKHTPPVAPYLAHGAPTAVAATYVPPGGIGAAQSQRVR